MTDQELQQLAKEYAETIKETVIGQKDLAMSEAEQFLTWLTKTHCIVEKEKVISEYVDAKTKRDLYMSATCINTMESRAIDHSKGRLCELNTLFGKSTFEEKSEK